MREMGYLASRERFSPRTQKRRARKETKHRETCPTLNALVTPHDDDYVAMPGPG